MALLVGAAGAARRDDDHAPALAAMRRVGHPGGLVSSRLEAGFVREAFGRRCLGLLIDFVLEMSL